MTCVSFQIFFFFFVVNYSHMCIRTGTTTMGVYESYTSYEGQVNRTQQEYNLLGQRSICQSIYIHIYWLWITVWSEVQIGVDDGEKEKKRDRNECMNEKQIWWSWLFILLLLFVEAHSHTNKVIKMKTINVTEKPYSFVFYQDESQKSAWIRITAIYTKKNIIISNRRRLWLL